MPHFPKSLNILCNLELKISQRNPPWNECFDANQASPCCTPATGGVWCRRRFSKPANVQLASFISKNRMNRQNDNRIQAAQNARRPACGWSSLTWSFFLCWGGFHLSSMWLICQHEKRHICLDMSNRRVSIGGFCASPSSGRVALQTGRSATFNDKHRPCSG